MSELGGATLPTLNSPAHTVGPGRFQVGFEMSLTNINVNSQAWTLGTQGDANAGTETCDGGTGLGCNRFANSSLLWSRVHVRKGLPLGFELGTNVGYLANTTLWAVGAEVKWALFEGFRTGLGVLPDVAVKGAVQTVLGDREFNLTLPSLDLIVSKPFVMGGMGTLTPFVAGQFGWVLADSAIVDLTPDVDGFEECRPSAVGAEATCTRPQSDALPDGRYPGQDLNNNVSFGSVRATRARAAIGVQGQYNAFSASLSWAMDVATTADLNTDAELANTLQWTVNAGIGFTF